MKWGIIGTGDIADCAFMPGFEAANDCEMIAVADKFADKAKEFAKAHNIAKAYDTVDALLADPEVEIVYIATPVFAHCELAVKAANAKKNILLEKPMAMNVAECEKIEEAVNKNGVKIQIGHMLRFHRAHQYIKELIDNGDLGKIGTAHAQMSYYRGEYGPDGEPLWLARKELSGGGSMLDMGIHCVDLMRYWLGDVKEVIAFADTIGNELSERYSVEDICTAVLKFESGAQAVVDSTVVTENCRYMCEIYGTKGSAYGVGTVFRNPDGQCVVNIDGEQEYQYEPKGLFTAEIEAFQNAIKNDTPTSPNAQDGKKAVEIVMACYEASEKGKTVTLGN